MSIPDYTEWIAAAQTSEWVLLCYFQFVKFKEQVTTEQQRNQTHIAATCTMFLALHIPPDVTDVVHTNITERQDSCSSVCVTDSSIRERRQKDKEERLGLLLWRRPVTTLNYFLLETFIKLKELMYR